jgi:hypothetical protein
MAVATSLLLSVARTGDSTQLRLLYSSALELWGTLRMARRHGSEGVSRPEARMGRKLGSTANLSLVGLIIQKTNPAGTRARQRRRLIPGHRWVILLATLTIGGGILLEVLRVFGVV